MHSWRDGSLHDIDLSLETRAVETYSQKVKSLERIGNLGVVRGLDKTCVSQAVEKRSDELNLVKQKKG